MKVLVVLLSLCCTAFADPKEKRIHEIEALCGVTYCGDLELHFSPKDKPMVGWGFYCLGESLYHKSLAFIVPQWPTNKEVIWAKAASVFCSGWYLGLDAYMQAHQPGI